MFITCGRSGAPNLFTHPSSICLTRPFTQPLYLSNSLQSLILSNIHLNNHSSTHPSSRRPTTCIHSTAPIPPAAHPNIQPCIRAPSHLHLPNHPVFQPCFHPLKQHLLPPTCPVIQPHIPLTTAITQHFHPTTIRTAHSLTPPTCPSASSASIQHPPFHPYSNPSVSSHCASEKF